MRKKRCTNEDCYEGQVWDYGSGGKSRQTVCPTCQGTALLDDVERTTRRFKDRQNVEAAAGFLQALHEDPFDEVTHAAFADWLEERGEDDEAAYQRDWTREREEAEQTVDKVAAACRVSVERLLEAAGSARDGGKGLHLGIDTPDVFYNGGYDKFWEAFCVLTGENAPPEGSHDRFFVSCSC